MAGGWGRSTCKMPGSSLGFTDRCGSAPLFALEQGEVKTMWWQEEMDGREGH